MQTGDPVGRQLGEFVIQERIGRGGMATVYRALQTSVNRDVALKVLQLDEALEDQNFRRRFAQEAELIAALEHIHILPVYGYGIQDDLAYIAMRLLRGGSLADLMSGSHPIPLERSVEIFSQIGKGLAYAHSKGIVHRDLKPANILMDEVGHPYLTDFGLAKLIDNDAHMTKTGNIVGTPSYMSPEQLRGEPLDHRSDIYSLGVILYQMLTGKRPFDGDSSDVISIIYKHLEKQPTPPAELNPGIPDDVETIVMKALEKKPEDRFQSVGEMVEELQTATGLRSTGSFPLPSPELKSGSRLRRQQQRKWQLLIGGLLLVVIIIGLAAVLLMPRTSPTTTFKNPTIMADEKGTSTVGKPTDEELALARQRLGNTGFIAILTCNLSSEYHATITREMTDFAHQWGIETRVYNSENDSYLQGTKIETARLEGASAFIICPLDSSALDGALKALDEADYPLVLPSTGDKDLSYGGVIVNTDNYLLGVIPGRFGGQLIRDEMNGEAQVIILDYPELEYLVQRANGLEDGIKQYAPNASIIGRYKGATRDFARDSVSKLITDGVHFDVIASINDAGSYGAIEAMEDAGIDPASVAIVSVDAEQLAQEYISRGYFMRASVGVARTEYAQVAIGLVIRQLAGATLPRLVVLAPGELVTRKSLEQKGS